MIVAHVTPPEAIVRINSGETSRLDCLFSRAHAGTVSAPARARTPQQERSRATQQRLLAATVECLVEHGWAGTTTTLIAERAGVSRGAQLHHYPTKAALVLAAVSHLAERRAAEIRAEAADLRARTTGRARRPGRRPAGRRVHRTTLRGRARVVGRRSDRSGPAGGPRPAGGAHRPRHASPRGRATRCR